MSQNGKVNDLVIRFANVNGTGSASANGMFAKTLFRMGLPISAKNIFPSNIQGLPTWYEVRINDKGYLGRLDGIDIMVALNPQSFQKDVASVKTGGFLIYDNSKPLHNSLLREDINFIGVPMMRMCMEHYRSARKQQLLKNVVYVGALTALLKMDMDVVKEIVGQQFAHKEKLIPDNFKALELGANYILDNFQKPFPLSVEKRDLIGDKILIDGNTATALGLLYGGATVAAWYPITPSTSVTQSFINYANKLRYNRDTKKFNVAILQAEDELAAIGMVIGAAWNGARAFTSTSGAGVSLMNEFIGLAYFAEIPVVIINVQRGGPSTGMPTRTQQADIISTAYASHGDTKHILLFPANPRECFLMAAQSLDLADRLQTPVFLMSDLDLGMNDHVSEPLEWDDQRKYDRGKVLTAAQLDEAEEFGRYLDVDGDGIPYRTYPGTHPTKGAFFTRGTSRDEYARYTEQGDAYVRNVNRLSKKWETSKSYVPEPEISNSTTNSNIAIVFFGTSTYATQEACDMLKDKGIELNSLRLRAFPFQNIVGEFINKHDHVFVIEQNKDAQMRSLLITEESICPSKLIPVLNYDGLPITADYIYNEVKRNVESLTKIPSAI
ncbi:MAG: 2-oxoacid:acceptor oxidoreductase subunit alpha [Saprospiraceae bacterium]|nr:2-oxoacid:acceptor oxidoreductase subunit alpha [Saprospiraceae bacterium]